MIPALARFAEALRGEGVEVSPAEILDASAAIGVVGIEDRVRFRAALRATLAKTSRAAAVFDATFDRFFAPPRRVPRSRKGREGGPGEAGKPSEDPSGGRRPDARRDDPARDAIRRAIEGTRSRGDRRTGRLRRATVEKGKRIREPEGEAGPLLTRSLRVPMATEDERRLARLLPGILETLRLREGRRMRRGRRGDLFVRGIFRENLGSEGVPFVLPFRRPKRAKARVVLLVDVSWSVARAAGYFLWMAASCLAMGRRARVLAFVDRPVEITEPLARWVSGRATAPSPASRRRGGRPGDGIAPGAVSFADFLEGLHDINLQAPSDYGRAFHALAAGRHRPTGRDTILVVLGDGRTNRFEPLGWALEDLARRCRTVIWLVPEPEGRWGTGDSALSDYLPHVDVVVEASDLAGLTRGLAELLRRL